MTPDFSVVIPCYNEEENVQPCVKALVNALNAAEIRYEIVLVDNGSIDNTSERIRELAQLYRNIKHVGVKKNIGYGNGIRKGVAACKARISGWTDADNQIEANDVVEAYRQVAVYGADMAFGIRERRFDGFKRRLESALYNALLLLLFWGHIGDVNAKPKVFRTSLYKAAKLRSNSWFIDTEIALRFRKMGCNIARIPVTFEKRAKGKSKVNFGIYLELFMEALAFRLGRQ